MKKNQVGTNNIVTFRLESTMRSFGAILPLLVVMYGVLIHIGWVEGSLFYSPFSFGLFVVASVILGILQSTVKDSRFSIKIGFTLAHHVLLAMSLLYVFGVLGPMLLMWLLLILVTMSLFGRRWAALSYVGLLMVMTIDIVLTHTNELSAIAVYAINAAFIGTLALVFAALRTLEFEEQKKLMTATIKQSKQREALLTIINGTSQAIFTVSVNGRIRIYNAALLGLLDTNKSLSGQSVDDVLNLLDSNNEPITLSSLMSSSPHFERDDLKLRFDDGDEIRLHISVNKIQTSFSSSHQSDDQGYVCIARDVTKQKSLEEERDEFISVVSHELRTPVAITEGTLSNLQFLLDQGTSTKKLSPSLSEAHEQVLLLANMINDLGTLSRAERGVGDDAEEIDIRDLVEGLYKKYNPSAEKKGLSLDIDASGRLGTVVTSRLYLEELLQNLITNAIKYTQKGSVTIKVRRSGGIVEFMVKDTGIGISKTDLKHVFEKFYRSEDYRTRETSGTGLGLYVAQKLLHKLGAKVAVTSRLNHGSTFSFTLAANSSKTKA